MVPSTAAVLWELIVCRMLCFLLGLQGRWKIAFALRTYSVGRTQEVLNETYVKCKGFDPQRTKNQRPRGHEASKKGSTVVQGWDHWGSRERSELWNTSYWKLKRAIGDIHLKRSILFCATEYVTPKHWNPLGPSHFSGMWKWQPGPQWFRGQFTEDMHTLKNYHFPYTHHTDPLRAKRKVPF